MSIEKPPLGAPPHWFVYAERMKELCDAISRNLEYARKEHAIESQKERYKQISKWCLELKTLAKLEAEMEGET